MKDTKEEQTTGQELARIRDRALEAMPEELAAAIRFHRKKGSLTQQELARLAGLGKAVIFDIEKGKKTVQLDTVLKVLKILNIEMCFSSPLMKQFLKEQHAQSRSIRSR